MTERAALGRLGAFLHLLAAGMFVGTIAELLAAEHYDGPLQLVPFALCGLGLLALAALRLRPTPGVILGVRLLTLALFAGSALGVYEHVMGNLDFVREVRLHADTMTVVKGTLRGGNPVLAPGVLALAALVTLGATYARSSLAAAEGAPAAEEAPGRQRTVGSLPNPNSLAAPDR